MLCLYCETELNPFRGLFDEDFCCREHREKYFSRFRKALTDFGSLEKPARVQPAAPPQEEVLAPSSDPAMPGFRSLPVAPAVAGSPANAWQPEWVAARHPVEILNPEMAWTAVLEFEERPADVAWPADLAASRFEPAPSSLPVPVPRVTAEFQTSNPKLEMAGPAAGQDTASGYRTPWGYAEPVDFAPDRCSLLPFSAPTGTPVLPAIEEFAESTVFCQQIAGEPIIAGEIIQPQQTSLPVFTPVCDSMHADEEQEPTGDPLEPYWGELYREPAPGGAEVGSTLAMAQEIVPVMMISSAHHDRPVLVPIAPALPHSLEIAPARPVSVPPLSAVVPPPAVAPELAAVIADSDAADSAAEPRSHEPMRLTFGNLVRIRNWRLRITFAKPA